MFKPSLLLLLLIFGCQKRAPSPAEPHLTSPEPGLVIAQIAAGASATASLLQVRALAELDITKCWVQAGVAKTTGSIADVLLYRSLVYPGFELTEEECGQPAFILAVGPELGISIDLALRSATIMVESYGHLWPCESYARVSAGLLFADGAIVTNSGTISAAPVLVPECPAL